MLLMKNTTHNPKVRLETNREVFFFTMKMGIVAISDFPLPDVILIQRS